MSRYWSSIVHRLTPYVAGEQPAIADLVKLNTNENPYGPSPHVIAAIKAQIGDFGCIREPISSSTEAVAPNSITKKNINFILMFRLSNMQLQPQRSCRGFNLPAFSSACSNGFAGFVSSAIVAAVGLN